MPRQIFFYLFPINFFFCSLELLPLWKISQFWLFIMTWDEQEHQNIPSSFMLEPFWIWTVQPSLELLAGTAEVCHGQISVKPEYNLLEAFTRKQANMLWVLLTQRHTPCSSCSIDPALWHESVLSAAMRMLSDNYSAMFHPSCCTGPPSLPLDGGAWPLPRSTHWAASGLALFVKLPSPCSGA